MAANRRFTSQFSYSFERQPVRQMGAFTQTSIPGTAATLASNSITWTAARFGTAGNDITVAIVSGGTAGAEVVTVTNSAISVKIESGVTTRTQVLTAVQASAAASALVNISVATGGTAASLLAATHLATGTSTTFSSTAAQNSMTIAQIGTGLFEITLPNTYPTLLSANIMLQKASATDIKPQMKSSSISTTGKIQFRTIAVGTNTDLASGDVIYIALDLRNSGS